MKAKIIGKYTYTENNDSSVDIFNSGEKINVMDAFMLCERANNIWRAEELLRQALETLNEFELDYFTQQRIKKYFNIDSEMLFHECPQCNSRCNCSKQPCECCSGTKSANVFGKDTKPNQST